MSNIKLKATDTLHITSVRAEPLLAGDTFEVAAEDGKSLVERGLAAEFNARTSPTASVKSRSSPAVPKHSREDGQ
jgi:hypothetical protein